MDIDFSLLNKTYVGFEFEFLTELSDNDLKNKLEKFLNKKIILQEKYHSDIIPTSRKFKIEPDYSAGINGRELITGPIPFEESLEILEKMLNFIRKFGKTTEKTAFQPNISFDKSIIKSLKHDFNPIKFILDLDEKYIYDQFPNRKNNLYAKSIKKLKLINSNYIASNNYNSIISYPNTKYYGINFEKLQSDYLEIRYIGGANYELKFNKIKNVWFNIVEAVWKASIKPLNNFNKKNQNYLNNLIEEDKNLKLKLRSAESFKKYFKKIKFSVDMEANDRYIDNKLYLLKDKLHLLFSNCDLVEGNLNYDSEKGRFQLKNFTLENLSISNVDLITCKINNCIISDNSEIHRSVIKNSDIEGSKLFKNEIFTSRLKDSFIDKKNIVHDSYIKGRKTFFDGILKSGIFREGYILKNAKINSNTVDIIEFKKMNKI